MEAFFPRRRSFFTTAIVIIAVNGIIIGGFLAHYFLNRSPKPELVTAAGLPGLSFGTNIISDTPLPSPTRRTTPVATRTPTATPTPASTTFPTATQTPTATPPLVSSLEGIQGHPQSLPLSCESRSATDWAAYFGKKIDEISFFNGLPGADNPEIGFVGSVDGSWGQIPPADYGVHAKPVAQRLREFGLNAKAVNQMSWEELKAEIAAGRPVIIWVVGHVNLGTPVPYNPPGGGETTVAKFEHTVIVIGYDENKVTVLDGARVYSRYRGEFMKSWDVLGNQAVIWID